MNEARIRSDTDIYYDYFKPAVQLLQSTTAAPDQQAEVHRRFALFADSQLSTLQRQQEDMRRLSEAQVKRQQHISDLRSRAQGSQGSRKTQLDAAVHESARVASEERKMLSQFEATKDRYTRLSMEQTSKVLSLSDSHDSIVYRLIALWFSCSTPHSSEKRSRDKLDKLHADMIQQLKDIRSAKFVFMAAQLTARLSKQSSRDSPVFKKGLRLLVDRLTYDHPFHLLYLLYNLRYSSGGPSSSKSGRRSSAVSNSSLAQAARAKAAEDVVGRLKSDATFSERLTTTDTICDAYDQWASFDARQVEGEKKRRQEAPHRLPANMLLRKLQGVALPVSTYHLPVDPTGRYADPNTPTISRYEESFKIAGGLNRPKISDCIGSDGRRYKQLVRAAIHDLSGHDAARI